MRLDPRDKADAIIMVITAVIYSLDFVAVLYLLWNRKYPPLKAKNPLIMVLVKFANIIWFSGDLQTSGHIPLANTPMVKCKAFGIWIRFMTGVCLQNSVATMQTYGLYRIFTRFLPYYRLGLYLLFTIYCLCLIAFETAVQVLKPSITAYYVALLDLCNYHL
ncbi:hypothetical protein LPJ66_002574 [Kickxella alabastrina]|uniref:Uncharacterized protein n=1 Tax=Kickxella alabastrina TaxID=61397 RepID=A0ACC1IQ34_9FUNG|nr:hypothetical protein LPJ66_002574 [Kickxella alabastrina]